MSEVERRNIEQMKRIIAVDVESKVWGRIFRVLRDYFGSDEGLSSIEFGGGRGLWSLMLSSYKGFSATLLGVSGGGQDRLREEFGELGEGVKFLAGEEKKGGVDYGGVYDVSMSRRYAEHKSKGERAKIFREHYDCLKERGVAIIAVPNRRSIAWQIYRLTNKLVGKVGYLRRKLRMGKEGKEFGFTRAELVKLASETGFQITVIIGTPFLQDLYYYVYYNYKRIILRVLKGRRLAGVNEIARSKFGAVALPFDDSMGAYLYMVAMK